MVWPALLPPWKRTTASACSASRSVIFPFPSSPHWAPTMTIPGMNAFSVGGAEAVDGVGAPAWPPVPGASAHVEHDLARGPPLVERPQGLRGLREGVAKADDRAYVAGVDELAHGAADLAIAFGLADHVGTPTGADDLDVVEEQA